MTSKSIFVYILALLLLSSCARSYNDLTPCITGHIYGFWGGLWHGLISPFDLITSLFQPEVKMFAPNNNGGWYGLGFLFGSGGWGVLANKSTHRNKVK